MKVEGANGNREYDRCEALITECMKYKSAGRNVRIENKKDSINPQTII